jgi:hypothetical protein
MNYKGFNYVQHGDQYVIIVDNHNRTFCNTIDDVKHCIDNFLANDYDKYYGNKRFDDVLQDFSQFFAKN